MDDAGNGRVVGLDEGCQDVRDAESAAPLVVRQDTDVLVGLRQGRRVRPRDQPDRPPRRLRQPGEEGAIEPDVEILDDPHLARAKLRHPPRARPQHRRLGR